MSFMSKVLGVFGFLGESMFGSMIGALKSAIPQVRVGVAGTKESRKWFSAASEKEFHSRRLEDKARVESLARLTVAR